MPVPVFREAFPAFAISLNFGWKRSRCSQWLTLPRALARVANAGVLAKSTGIRVIVHLPEAGISKMACALAFRALASTVTRSAFLHDDLQESVQYLTMLHVIPLVVFLLVKLLHSRACRIKRNSFGLWAPVCVNSARNAISLKRTCSVSAFPHAIGSKWKPGGQSP